MWPWLSLQATVLYNEGANCRATIGIRHKLHPSTAFCKSKQMSLTKANADAGSQQVLVAYNNMSS